MRFKYKAIIWIVTLAALYLFRYEILGHFGMEDMLPPKEQTAVTAISLQQSGGSAETPEPLPAFALINQSGTKVYRRPGRGVMAEGTAGDQVSLIDIEDTGQKYINVRYNGIAGYINRGQLKLNK